MATDDDDTKLQLPKLLTVDNSPIGSSYSSPRGSPYLSPKEIDSPVESPIGSSHSSPWQSADNSPQLSPQPSPRGSPQMEKKKLSILDTIPDHEPLAIKPKITPRTFPPNSSASQFQELLDRVPTTTPTPQVSIPSYKSAGRSCDPCRVKELVYLTTCTIKHTLRRKTAKW